MSRPPAGSLVLVATPIGNLGDLSARALDVLGHADVNLAQDYVDAIVMSGYSKKTSMKAVSRAVDQLSTPKLLGMALVG